MTITATVVADSISERSPRLTTFQLRYPKFIHGEAKTHRLMKVGDKSYDLLEEVGFMDDPNISRNASSSRAIPVKRLIQDVMDDPAMPIHWGANQKGMQADKECDTLVDLTPFTMKGMVNKDAWLAHRDTAVRAALAFDEAGYHKQIVNRLLEPFCHINVICTATNYSNFFALRRHKDAQPEMKALADAMWEAMEKSKPKKLKVSIPYLADWHLPYVSDKEKDSYSTYQCIKFSVARCARVSYLTQDGKEPSIEEDLKLYDRLVGSVPLHASPAEHQACPDTYIAQWSHPELHGNLHGWVQFRKTLPGECQ
jgi:Thymidylate synthase complementing protein